MSNCEGQPRIIGVASIEILSPEDSLDFIIHAIEILRNCKKHDHKEDIWQLEKLQKEMISGMRDRMH